MFQSSFITSVPGRAIFGCVLWIAMAPKLIVAQSIPATAASAGPGTELTVYLMTMEPGGLIYEKFGHNAIWIQDSLRGTDIAYNYGLFDFEQENFLLRFIQGKMLYWMEGFDAGRTIQAYHQQNRSVWAQELNLTPARRVELRDFLEWNERPENRFYRYDYYRDNCSTRVRDAIDRVLDGRLGQLTKDAAAGTTYRFHTRRVMAENVFLYTAVGYVLGQPIDQPIFAWEECFLPMKLREYIGQATVIDANGNEWPLVKSERMIPGDNGGGGDSIRQTPPNWIAGYLTAGVLLGAILAALAHLSKRSRLARFGFASIAAGWALLTGLAGTLVIWGLIYSDHWAIRYNENLFSYSPLALPLVILAPRLAFEKYRGAKTARWLAILIAAGSVLGWMLQALPAFDQVNGEIIALSLPINIALAWSVWRLTPKRTTESRKQA